MEDVIDVIITQNPDVVVRNAMQIFRNVNAGIDAVTGVPPLTMEIVAKENLPWHRPMPARSDGADQAGFVC